jgi:cytochrome c biogenesis protein CcmG/thiol:disulfide interchange protein DsbE
MARARIGRSGILGLVAGLLVVFAVAVFAGVSFSSSSKIATATAGSTAPAWSGTSLDGVRLSSGALRGRWVVLNFFATWCEGCQEETPALEAFVVAHPTTRVQVVSVLHADSAADARRFARAHAMTWPIVSTGADAVARDFKLAGGLPQTEVIDPDGKLVTALAGAVNEAQLDRIVSDHSPS